MHPFTHRTQSEGSPTWTQITARVLTFGIWLFADPAVCESRRRRRSWRGNRGRRSQAWPCPSSSWRSSSSSQPGRGTARRTTGQRRRHRFSSAWRGTGHGMTWFWSDVKTAQLLNDADTTAAYLIGPAKKIAVRHVNRPAETIPSWLSFPCCHAILVFSKALSGKSSSTFCHTDMAALMLLLGADSFLDWDFGGVTPPLNVCGPLGETGCSGKS